MNVIERKRKTIEMLKDQHSLSVSKLSQVLGVSMVTVRSDLDDLEKRGLIVRTHGEACIAEHYPTTRFITHTLTEMKEAKEKIADIAFSLINKNVSIIIDSGSTTVFLARKIKDLSLTVVTNSVLVLQELLHAEHMELMIAGGTVRKPSLSLIGSASNQFLESINTHIFFMGASGFSVDQGISCTNLVEAETKRHMISRSMKVCLLVDSSKCGDVYMAHICGWDAIDCLITDSIDPEVRSHLEKLGVTVLTDIPSQHAKGRI